LIDLIGIFLDDFAATLSANLGNFGYFFVDNFVDLFGIFLLIGVLTNRHIPDSIAHSQLHHDIFGETINLLKVISRAGRDLIEEVLFGTSSPKNHANPIHELLLRFKR
jgi:hypothetical protein